MKKTRNAKGITLIALVITIIILLILAGITLNILLGEGGIIQQAEQARDEWERAEIEEKEQMLKAEAKILETQNNTKHEMLEYYIDGVPIPKGFVYKEGTKETGLIIINKEDENEFVWVPKSKEEAEEDLKSEIDLLLNNPDYPEGQKLYASIKEYGGYYAARYQAGADVEITSLEQADQKVYSKPGKYPYIHISIEKVIRLSKSMYPETEENTTGAISTYKLSGTSLRRSICDKIGFNWIPGGPESLRKEYGSFTYMDLSEYVPGYAGNATSYEYYDLEKAEIWSRGLFYYGGQSFEYIIKKEEENDATFRPLLYIKLPE